MLRSTKPVILACIWFALGGSAWCQMKREDPIESVLAAFDSVNLVALGERHWAQEDSQFRLALIQNPAFPQKVNTVVIEFANPIYQALLDRFVNGEPVSAEEIQHVWRDTTQPGAFDSPVYEQFLNTVRAVNAKLGPHARIRVLAGDYPIDWPTVSAPGDLDGPMQGRDRSAATVIQREVLDRRRKALVLFGAAHLYRNRPNTIVDLLKGDSRAKWFIIVPVSEPALPTITANSASAKEPALIKLAGNPVGRLPAGDVLEIGTRGIKIIDGRPVFQDGKPVFIPVFEGDVKAGDLGMLCYTSAPPSLYRFSHRPVSTITPNTESKFNAVVASSTA